MARAAAKQKRRPWTAEDFKMLKQLTKDGVPTTKIAKQLKRTPAAVYQRAAVKGIKLGGGRNRSGAKKKSAK